MAAEAASLGYNTPQGVGDVNTRGKKAPKIVVKGAGGAILTGFYPNWSKLSDGEKQSLFDKRGPLNIKGGGKLKKLDRKRYSRANSIKFKNKVSQNIQHEISSLKPKCKELKKKRSSSKETNESQDKACNKCGGRKVKNQ